VTVVSETVEHILRHVLAEATVLQDPSQTDGVQDRADYVIDAIDTFTDDERDIETEIWLRELSLAGKPGRLRGSWRRMLLNAEKYPDDPQVLIQDWVGMESEDLGG